jgi:N utilization substance protein B
MGHRRAARECALQMLYQLDVGKHTEDEILHTFWQMNERSQDVRAFADELFVGTARRLKEIDKTIQQHATNWRLSRMAVVDRNILRLAIFEFLSGKQTPKTVVINEALEIAKKYSTHESAQFVNGILDSIKNALMEEGQSGNGKSD